MKRTRVHTQYFTRLLQPLFFFLSLPHSPLSSLSHPLSPLLAIFSSRSFPSRSVSTKLIFHSVFLVLVLMFLPEPYHRNKVTETKSLKHCKLLMEKSLPTAGVVPGFSLSTRECAIHLAMLNPQTMKEKMFYLFKRERGREWE
jgi:hypothetical protein